MEICENGTEAGAVQVMGSPGAGQAGGNAKGCGFRYSAFSTCS